MQSSPNSVLSEDRATLPPWEKEDIAQVPHLASSSPKLSCAEREALPILWAARSNTVSGNRPSANAHARSAASSPSCPAYDAVRPQTSDRPFHRVAQSPASPQDNESWYSTPTPASDSPPAKHEISPMAGTMSSRDTHVKSTTRKTNGGGMDSRHRRSNSTRLQRWGSVVKHMFIHHAAQDGELERIETRHWTDES